ncbi:VPA1262 family N-terminal domain-containing protein [Lysinibacillus sp. FSL K6-0057]|uniref:VPA1262 family N-terminal domain-containing protein n=1 Tax=Lysinibacillus sp. FSL K6-0057 TaxID=2921411 RepID=UPI00315A07C8
MSNEFTLLQTPGVLGFYQSCEVTMIFIYNKKLKTTYNLYTLIAFEERPYSSPNESYLSNPFHISKDFFIGIFQYNLTLEEITEAYNHLLQQHIWRYKEKEFQLIGLQKLNKQFIKCNGTSNVPLNSILKNNFHNGSYIIEFFDTEKTFLNELLQVTSLEKINHYIKNILPIDLQFMNDRIGNIIFQFPSNLTAIHYRSTENWDGMNVELVWDARVLAKEHYALQIFDNFDETITSFHLTHELNKEKFTVTTGNSKSLNTVQIIDTKHQLILYSKTASFMQHLAFNMDIGGNEPRTIQKAADRQIETIDVVAQNNSNIKGATTERDWIRQRKYKNAKDVLTEQLEFIQYGKNGNERTKALQDIRTLINRHGREGVYLWDPYLTYEDLIDTLYYCKYLGAEMKAITSCDKKRMRVYQHQLETPKENLTISEWYAIQVEGLQSSSNNVGMNLEFRCQHHNFGWKFHDRFLIFPSPSGEPKVWSLGISVNGLGKEHHILQLVSNPQNIIDAFNDLWSQLNHEECVIWRS